MEEEMVYSTRPAYGLTTPAGPQCSQNDEFCFFCAYADMGCSHGDIDLRATLVNLVQTLHREKKEILSIVHAVNKRYNEDVRPYTQSLSDATGPVESPEWTQESIKRHLLYSTEFPNLFPGVVTQIFQTILVQLNATMCNDEGDLIEEKRKAFLDTVKSFQQWSTGRAAKENR